MPPPGANVVTKSGIKTTAEGESVIPASKRADGSTRKEIRVRPGYTPPEDVATYKNRNADAFKNRGSSDVPGLEPVSIYGVDTESKSKNAKRREAARKKAQGHDGGDGAQLAAAMKDQTLDGKEKLKQDWRTPSKLAENPQCLVDEDAERQKKIRNLLKKLKAVRELKEKKAIGEKLSPDQIMKIGKEPELVRDLQKLKYDGPEMNGVEHEEVDEEALAPSTERNGHWPA